MSCDEFRGLVALERGLILFKVEVEEDRGLGDMRLAMLAVVAAASLAVSDLSCRRGGIEDSWNLLPLLYFTISNECASTKNRSIKFN